MNYPMPRASLYHLLRSRVLHSCLVFVLPVALSGCMNCNMLSSGGNSPACGAVLIGGAVLLSPLLLAGDAERKAIEEEQEKAFAVMKEDVQQGKVEALEKCMVRCAGYSISKEEKDALRWKAALKLIKTDTPNLPDNRLIPMIIAYSETSIIKGKEGQPEIVKQWVERGWELAQRLSEPQVEPIKSNVEKLARNLFTFRLLALPADKAEKELKNCVQSDLMPKAQSTDHRFVDCWAEYNRYHRWRHGKDDYKVPPEIEKGWKIQEWVEDSKIAENNWAKQKDSNHAAVKLGVEKGERWALEICVRKCPFIGGNRFERYLSSSFEPLRHRAAAKLIALDRPSTKPDNPEAISEAYSLLLLEKLPGGKIRLNLQRLNRGMEIAKLAKDINNVWFEFATVHFLAKLDNLTQTGRENAFETCVSSRWLQSFPARAPWPHVCESAYKKYAIMQSFAEEGVPSALDRNWWKNWTEKHYHEVLESERKKDRSG